MTKKATSRSRGLMDSSKLKVLNDIVIVREDPIKNEIDNPSGLTADVVKMIDQGKLVIPDISEFALKKYPCTGEVINVGPKCKNGLKVGNRVLFARQGCLREKIDGKDYVIMREADIHAILD